jgi:uncharacterized protein
MHDRDWYPAGVPCWIDTAQPDPKAAAGFYGGWRLPGYGEHLASRDPGLRERQEAMPPLHGP